MGGRVFSGVAIAVFGFFIALFILSDMAAAQNEYWSVSAANWGQYWYFNEGRRDSLDNRFIVDFDLGNFYTGAWLEVLEPDRPDGSYEEISQRYFGWHEGGLTLQAGNFYQAFDRGLSLNAFLDDAVYYDNNLDGIKVTGLYDGFEFDMLSARGMNNFTGDRDYIIRGVRGKIKPFEAARAGFSYVRFKQNDFSDFSLSQNANITSFNSGVSYGPLDIYAEYAMKRGRPEFGQDIDGDGTYLTGSMSFELFSVFAEYKNYINLLYPNVNGAFNNPPPVSHQGRNLASLNGVPGERGYQAGLYISPTYDLNFDLSFSESFSRGFPVDYYLAEKFAGARWSPTSEIVLNYSFDRFDWTIEDEIENYFDAYYNLTENHTASLTAYSKRFIPSAGEDYHEDYLILGYGLANRAQFNIGGSKSNFDAGFDPDKLAFAELIIRFSNHELIIFNGGERGGLICSSGLCQNRPTFIGTRMMLFSRF